MCQSSRISSYKQQIKLFQNPPQNPSKNSPLVVIGTKSRIPARNKALNLFQKINDQKGPIIFKKHGAKARALIRLLKKQSWSNFVASINRPASSSAMWSQS